MTSKKNRLQSYMGYAFESYCSSSALNPSEDRSRLPNGWSGDVDTNVQWCSVVKTKLGDYRLLIGGEVDCVRGRLDSHVVRDTPTDARVFRQIHRSTKEFC
jgi:RAT1-interacting protein